MVLLPESVDIRLEMPHDALHVFHRVGWRAPVPSDEFELSCQAQWVSALDSRAEIGLATVARSRGEAVAESLMVVRAGIPLKSWGERGLPSRPGVPCAGPTRSLVVDALEVSTFARLAGTSYPVHDDAAYARSLGYPDVLVQGLLLLTIELRHNDPGNTGQIEMWFRRPIPAGSPLDIQTSGTNPMLSEYRLAADGQIAASAAVFDGG